jgi:hypothetical protein
MAFESPLVAVLFPIGEGQAMMVGPYQTVDDGRRPSRVRSIPLRSLELKRAAESTAALLSMERNEKAKKDLWV